MPPPPPPPPFRIPSRLHRPPTNPFETQLRLQLPSPFSTRPKWNSNHNLIVTNPVLSLMESCTSMAQLKQIQSHMTRTGLMTHRFPASRVVAFCALSDHGDMDHARLVFSQVSEPNTYIWNTMIRGYARWKCPLLAFGFLREMVRGRVGMDGRSFVFGLKAAEQFPGVVEGEEVHCLICKMGFVFDLLVRNGLMHLYGKRGLLDSARDLFDGSPERDVVSWTTMIDACVQVGLADEALKMFFVMMSEKVEPNEVTMVAVLSACSRIGILGVGRYVHRFIEQRGLSSSSNLLNALIDMYGKCGCVETARDIFDSMKTRDVFSWTSMINGYAKSGDLEEAVLLFQEMPERNVVSWSTLIAGYVNCNQPDGALELFHNMISSYVKPIAATLLSVLSACSQSGRLDLGQWIYKQYVIQERIMLSTKLANAFLDMYAKCGAIDNAARLFIMMPGKDLVSWNTMVLGYAAHGLHKEAISLFNQMIIVGVMPDAITFVGVLSACGHGGLVEEGRTHFESMRRVFGITPNAEHYTCMIDLFGRVGLLEEAKKLISSMPMEPDKAGWGALLSACRMHKNVELGKLSGQKLLSLDSSDSGVYSILSNMYADANKWADVMAMRRMMRECGVKKSPGRSLIEIEGKFHKFFASDRSHLLSQEMHDILDEIYLQLKWEGYVPIM